MRKGFILLSIILLLMVTGGVALSGQSSGNLEISGQFDRANQLYEDGKYADALTIYQTIEKQSVHWKLFFNIGNCYYKSNNFVKAKIYYLKAERLRPFEPSIQKNIDVVNKRFSDKIEVERPDFLSRVALRIENVISLNIVSVVLLIAVIVLNVFVFLLIKNGRARFLLYGVSFSLVAVLLFSGYHIYRTGKQNLRNTAVIVTVNTELRSGPGEDNTILFKVNPGLKVKIIEKSRNWVHVSASSNIAGWIEADRLERI